MSFKGVCKSITRMQKKDKRAKREKWGKQKKKKVENKGGKNFLSPSR